MSFISRSSLRIINHLSKTKQYLAKHITLDSVFAQSQHSIRPLSRSLVMLSSPSRGKSNKHLQPSKLCSCGCGIHGMHTKGDRELVEFLQEEIAAEKKTQAGSVPSSIDDFTVKQDKAELTLSKKFNDEEITISLNVNHTVGADTDVEEEGGLASRPDFDVDVKIGPKTWSFTCQFTSPAEAPEGEQIEDAFGISEMTIYDGEWKEKVYCASGDILDGVMYDLLMNFLEERGITRDFVDKLSNLCTTYEHGLYLSMLEQIQAFIKRK